jgi:ABC-type multidrug transport system ATPase subunit
MKEQGVTEDKLQLLNDINGAFRPGILTALVGVSGAGKTTFMDVLAGRKTGGYIEGSIYISGHPKKQETFARIAGYCEQFDIHSPNVTVHESLLYSAWLRLSKDVNTEVRRVIKTMSTYFACLLYYILAFLLGNCTCGCLLINICLDGTFGNCMWGFY